ncbi:MAG: GWxTD domain-containing protein [Chlorobi bacterium]|nr:GWxTD domain-containing protein [Chlorobiota bacterium]
MRYIVLLMLIFVTSLNAQHKDKSFYYDTGKKFYSEIHLIPTSNPDSVEAVTFFRASYDLFSFKKTQADQRALGKYIAYPNMEVEFKNADGIIKKSAAFSDTIFVNHFDSTNSKTKFVHGYTRSKLEVGEYNPVVRLHDNKNRNMRKQKPEYVLNNDFAQEWISHPIFVREKTNAAGLYQSYVLQNNSAFSEEGVRILINTSTMTDAKYHYSIKYVGQKRRYVKWDSDLDISGTLEINQKQFFDISDKSDGNEILIEKKSIDVSAYDKFIPGYAELLITSDQTVPGSYSLTVTNDTDKKLLTSEFEIYWENMPVFLQRVQYAVNSMEYVLTDDEFDELDSGSDDKMSAKLIKWWKKKDPTPGTAFNEIMTEYFTRVDHSYFNFGTVKAKNGMKTDKAKVYILYGEPDDIETNMNDKNPKEIWKYKKLKKEFIFEVISAGDFRLIKALDLGVEDKKK